MMHDGQSVYDHYLIMIKDIKELERLDMTLHKELLVDLILRSLFNLYESFMVNYHLNDNLGILFELVKVLVTKEP